MNSSQLYAGEYYAYHPQPPRGAIPINAKKVRLRHTEQRKRSYDKNRHTVAAITVVDTGREMLVPARHLISFWDEYEVEQAHLLKEKREREKEIRRRNLRREVTESILNYRLMARGIPITVDVGYGEKTASFPIAPLIDWFGIRDEEIQEAIDKVMAKEYSEDEEEANTPTA